MREISPAQNMSVENFLEYSSAMVREHVSNIRAQKEKGSRPKPSTKLVDKSKTLSAKKRMMLIDKVADLVDEWLVGRSEMCIQFADLLERALNHLGVSARSVIGQAKYFIDGEEVFEWKHAWVETDDEIIDGNIDSTFENPFVPNQLNLKPYWGPITAVPNDRQFKEDTALVFPKEDDV